MIKQIIRKMRVRRIRKRVNRINSKIEKFRSLSLYIYPNESDAKKIIDKRIGNIKPK